MNRAALSSIARQAHWDDFCCAVQGRIAGAKGVWILHPEHQTNQLEEPRIWIRESQNKINLDLRSTNTSRAHLIFDLVSPAHLTYPTRLNTQTIVNLSHNGVPNHVFEKLLEDGIQSDYQRLTAWEGETAMKSLLHAVAQLGGLSGIRLGRELAGLGRVLGYGKPDNVEPSSEELQGGCDPLQVTGRAKFSGEPTVLVERIFEMIAAGFHPLTSRVLWENLEQMLKNHISSYILSFHIPTPESLEAFIIPGEHLAYLPVLVFSSYLIDPFGILEPNEIYFHASRCIKSDPLSDPFPNLLVGPVLVGSC
jgi:RNA-dependent RNA polymerase